MFKFLLNFIPGVGPFVSAAWTAISTFIVKYWKPIAIALLIGTIIYQNFSPRRYALFIETIPYLEAQIKVQNAEIATLKTDLDIAAKANAALTKTISDDNMTVEQWKDISDKLQVQNNELNTTLQQMSATNSKKVTNILNAKTPTTCEDSIKLLRDSKDSLTW